MADPLTKAFGRRVRELRMARGYSQEAFADAAGLHRTYMGAVERGETNVAFLNIAKMAATLGVKMSDMFIGLEERPDIPVAAKPAGRPPKSKP